MAYGLLNKILGGNPLQKKRGTLAQHLMGQPAVPRQPFVSPNTTGAPVNFLLSGQAGTPQAPKPQSFTQRIMGGTAPHVPNAHQLQNGLGRSAVHNFNQANQGIWSLINGLQDEYRQTDPGLRNAFLAPRLEQQDDYFDNAANRLQGGLAARGLEDSSAMSQGLGTIEGQRAGARASLATQLMQYEQGLRQQNLANQSGLLGSMQNQGGLASQILGQRIQQQQLQEQLDAQNSFGFGDALGGLLGVAGQAAGAGLFGGLGGAARPRTARPRSTPAASPFSDYWSMPF